MTLNLRELHVCQLTTRFNCVVARPSTTLFRRLELFSHMLGALCNDTPFQGEREKKKKEKGNAENLAIFGGTNAGPLKP